MTEIATSIFLELKLMQFPWSNENNYDDIENDMVVWKMIVPVMKNQYRYFAKTILSNG